MAIRDVFIRFMMLSASVIALCSCEDRSEKSMKGGPVVTVTPNEPESTISSYLESKTVKSVAEVKFSNDNTHIPSRFIAAQRELHWSVALIDDIDRFAELYKMAGAEGFIVIEFIGGFSCLPVYSGRVNIGILDDECEPTVDQFFATIAAQSQWKHGFGGTRDRHEEFWDLFRRPK
ncbi:MAG: hypothetical protein K9N23_07240 [Akkermansiaceae bacterium]|nr:hypothetical protein [Akkermansiaceae bacterium]